MFSSLAALPQALLHPLKAPAELAIGLTQRGFGIERQIASNIYQHKEKIADFFFQSNPQIFGNRLTAGTGNAAPFGSRAWRRKFLQLLAKLGSLFAKFREQAFHVRPVETNLCRTRAELMRLQQ